MATTDWSFDQRMPALAFAGIWIFVFTKSIKLIGHFVRYPIDFFLLPVSVAFGYVHGVIKLIGLFTLSEVSQDPEDVYNTEGQQANAGLETAWGSREGADTDDRYRMIRLPPYVLDEDDGPMHLASG